MNRVKYIYDLESSHYDFVRFQNPLGEYINKYEQDLVLNQVKGKTLELCCGTGRFAEHIKEYCGIDFSSEMLKRAKEKNPEKKFILLDVNRLNIIEDGFNTIFCVRAVKFWQNPEETLRQCYKLLNKDGKLILHFRHKNLLTIIANIISKLMRHKKLLGNATIGVGNEKMYYLRDIRQYCELAGFRIISYKFYFNPLFSLFNIAKDNNFLTKILIKSSIKIKWGWRIELVCIK